MLRASCVAWIAKWLTEWRRCQKRCTAFPFGPGIEPRLLCFNALPCTSIQLFEQLLAARKLNLFCFIASSNYSNSSSATLLPFTAHVGTCVYDRPCTKIERILVNHKHAESALGGPPCSRTVERSSGRKARLVTRVCSLTSDAPGFSYSAPRACCKGWREEFLSRFSRCHQVLAHTKRCSLPGSL